MRRLVSVDAVYPCALDLTTFGGTTVSSTTNKEAHFFVQTDCGSDHHLTLTASDEKYTWGYGETFALGHGDDNDELLPCQSSSEYVITDV